MRFTIGKRLGIGFGAMTVLMGVMAVSSWRSASETEGSVDRLNESSNAMEQASRVELIGHRLGARVSEYLLNPSKPETLKAVYDFKDKFNDQLAKLKEIAKDEKSRQAIGDAETKFAAIWPEFEQIKTFTSQAEHLTRDSLGGGIKSVCDDLTKLIADADAAGNVPARAAARQGKVTSLEAYMAAQRCIDSLSDADKADADKAMAVAARDLAAAAKNGDFGVLAERFAPVGARFADFGKAYETIVSNQRDINRLLSEKFHPKRFEAIAVVSELAKRLNAEAEETGKAVAAGAVRARNFSAAMGVSVAAIGAALGFFIARSITRPIRLLIARVVAIQAAKDLSQRVQLKSKDEVGEMGEAFNGLIGTLHEIIADVKSGASQIDAGGSQIASASQSLAQGASEQASSLQQISASLEEISGQTQQSAENARQASTLAEENKKSADRGQSEMAQMSKAVNEIKQSSAEISKIIKVIDEIAFQTNLLALNAAVEAARAGEAGKGFAVVAEEVRNLAQRSAEAAKNTSAMIEESVKRSENGVQIAGRVGQALEEINVSTNKVNTLLSEIASAAGEQATGISQVNQGVSQLDQVTQQNAGNSEEMASSAEELSAQVASLNELVAQFKVSEGVDAHTPHAATVPPHGGRKPATKPKAGAPVKAGAKAAKSVKPGASKPQSAVDKHAPADPEKVIPMENNEVLASF
jgi:methyl-accepting chemotaxis protein